MSSAHELRKVLLLDDEDDFRTFIAQQLEAGGLEVAQAKRLEEALSAVESSPPAILVADVVFPGGTAWELLELLTQKSIVLPVILMTGYHDLFLPPEYRGAVREVFFKPFSVEKLRSAVVANCPP